VRLGWRELVRQPPRFVAAGGALTLVVILLLVLGGFLDGLTLGSTGTIRALDGQLITYDDLARRTIERSRIGPDVGDEVAAVDGVESVQGLAITPTPVRVPDRAELADAALVAYEEATGPVPDPPAAGEAYADRRLEETAGVAVGQVLRIGGGGGVEVEVIGWVDDTSYLLQPTIWVVPETWRDAVGTVRPGAVLPEGTFQVLSVRLDGVGDSDEVASAIDDATGATETVTPEVAISSLGGVEEQRRTFTVIITVTLAIAGLVVGLFFALITLERRGLYAVLKAIGATGRDLVAGVATQALGVAAGAFVVGTAATLALLPFVPPDIPVRIEPFRVAIVGAGLLVTALIGAGATLRRVVQVDPAEAIG
jgi:putative ABC transport system permease protein